jgi:hypothetical protein
VQRTESKEQLESRAEREYCVLRLHTKQRSEIRTPY